MPVLERNTFKRMISSSREFHERDGGVLILFLSARNHNFHPFNFKIMLSTELVRWLVKNNQTTLFNCFIFLYGERIHQHNGSLTLYGSGEGYVHKQLFD